MSKIWVSPRQWDIAEPITAEKLQAYSDALEWLKDRPRSIVVSKSSNFVIVLSTTVWAAVSDAALTLSLTTSVANEDVVLYWEGVYSTATAVGTIAAAWDILVDDTNYISSGTPTPAAFGCRLMYNAAGSGNVQNFAFQKRWTVPTAGVHTFKLRVLGSTTNTLTVYSSSAFEFEFGALDI